MGSEFIDYLNSMNNANSSNLNALAESQLTNRYYNEIIIERKLGKYIVENIKNGINNCYIITGHAGDGKTSILVQVLKELNLINDNEKLKESLEISKENINLFYVKDMSELNENTQQEFLRKALECPKNNKTSILISNTGPLLKSFSDLLSENEDDKDNIENELLAKLESNDSKMISLKGFSFQLINIAMIDNINFVGKVIEKICSDKLWTDCRCCENNEKCPMYYNYKCVKSNKDRVIKFIETYYKWLSENNKRMTIRQMLAQISYAFTGNIRCSSINKFDKLIYNKFNFNFANLFFGHRGIAKIEDTNQIKGIRVIKDLKLDSIALKEDYDMFVKGNYSNFDDSVREVITKIWSEFSKTFYNNNNYYEKGSIEKQCNMRKAIRRFYFMYGNNDTNDLVGQLYGNMFVRYLDVTSNYYKSHIELRDISEIVFKAIYIENMGVAPKGKDKLYITLKRNDGNFQNVLLILAKAEKDCLRIYQVEKENKFEDTNQLYDIGLLINKEKTDFKLSLPMLMHFDVIANGEISTEINPSLSHGLTKLNSLLLKRFRDDNDGNELNIIVNTVNGNKELKLEFYNEKIMIE